MEVNFSDRLYGQKMASDVIDIINKTFMSVSAGMSLSIELDGPTGPGMSYAIELIAESIFPKGMNSPLVHTFDGEDLKFVVENSPNYKEKLQNWIIGNLKKCGRNMFIFGNSKIIPRQIRGAIQNVITAQMGGIFIFTTTEMGPVISKLCYMNRQLAGDRTSMHPTQLASALRAPVASPSYYRPLTKEEERVHRERVKESDRRYRIARKLEKECFPNEYGLY